jgi:hypothetical protein
MAGFGAWGFSELELKGEGEQAGLSRIYIFAVTMFYCRLKKVLLIKGHG